MPRRKQPRSLLQLSLPTVADIAVQACKRSRGQHEEEIISQYVCSIPNTLANEYVGEVLRVCSLLDEDFDITAALHRKCTEIVGGDYIFLSADWYLQLISSFHVMSDLQVFRDVSDGCRIMDIESPLSFPKLTKQRSIEISTLGSQNLLTPIIQSSPRLEEIVMRRGTQQPQDLRTLANFKRLRKILSCVPIQPSDAVHLLQHLPKLEVLSFSDVKDVLSLCKRPYPCFKDFGSALNVNERDILEKVATYFPNLEELHLRLEGGADLSPLNRLANLKSLSVKGGAASSLLCLLDNCMGHLSNLDLYSVHGLESIFGQDRNTSFSQLESLMIYGCTGVNLAAIGEIFPNLKSLQAEENEFTELHLYPTPHAFREIEDFCVDETMPMRYIRYLLSRKNLRDLQLDNINSTDSSACSQLFQGIRLDALQTLTIVDDLMTKEVIPLILGSSGDDLRDVSLRGKSLILSSSEGEELSNQSQPYDMAFCIGGSHTKFKYDSRK